MLYEKFVKQILCVQQINLSNLEQRDSAFSVAMTAAFLQGCIPKLSQFSMALGVPQNQLQDAYQRLIISGIFHRTADTKNDKILLSLGDSKKAPKINRQILEIKQRTAWCTVAGVGSGLTWHLYSVRFPEYNK